MNYITKNLKKAGIFNATLIIIAIVLRVYQMSLYGFKYVSFIMCFYDVATIVALLSGLFYAFYGYKKSAAKYYKVFMILTLIAFLASAIGDLPYSYLIVITCLAFIRLIPHVLLAFKKDFGKKNSLICAYVAFVLTLAIVFIGAFVFVVPLKNLIVQILNNILLSAITIIFVEAKYTDKEARGA